jgi:hypothetical protein
MRYRWERPSPDSEPLQRAQSGFSRDACHTKQPAVTPEALPALLPQPAGERGGALIDVATIPAEAGVDSLKRSTFQMGAFSNNIKMNASTDGGYH